MKSSGFDADLLILGGGCAGLSLATRLAAARTSLRVLVIEPRRHYVEDRTWCGWRTDPHPYMDCVAASWPRWKVIHQGQTIERGSQVYPYEMVPAARFYEHSCATIRATSSVKLCLGVTAEVAAGDEEDATVTTSDGRRVRARWVVDTRPPVKTLRFPSLWQNFVGYEVQGDQHWTARLGDTPVLMDFQPAGSAVIQFMYVLPLGAHRFLCEWTRFSTAHGEIAGIESDLQTWLQERGCAGGMMGRREFGSLPMSIATAPGGGSRRVVAAGTRGGSMRASTGYAFHSIQRWADGCAASLLMGGPPLAPMRNRTLDFLDEVFLTALQEDSVEGAAIFAELFARTPPDVLVRFLSGVPQAGGVLPVMASLPWLPFAKAALQTLLRKRAA